MRDVIRIAGAGLAGMTAGINLAKAGFNVRIAELRSDVGARFDHDFQFFENWTQEENLLDSLKRMNIDIDFPITPVRGGRVFDHRYRQYAIQCRNPITYMVRRGGFDDCIDYHLKRQALDCGVEFEFDVKMDPDDVDIVATGPPSSKSLLLARGALFRTNIESDVRVLFDPRISPKVYAYMVAHAGHGIVCTVYSKEHHHDKSGKDFIRSAIAAFQRTGEFEVEDVEYFSNFGVGPLVRRHSKIVVGEAAGFQDVTWGFGMRLAMTSGYLAARAIIEEKDYWESVRREILPVVVSTTVNRFILESLGRVATVGFLRWLHRSNDVIGVFRRIYGPRRIKNLLFPIVHRRFERRQNLSLRRRAHGLDGRSAGR